jgi:hypothetical protein
MTVHEEFADKLRQTDLMSQLIRSLDEEPAHLLHLICMRYNETGRPVADHYLQMTGFFGETMLRVLTSAGLIDHVAGERGALNVYTPTALGQRFDEGMRAERKA